MQDQSYGHKLNLNLLLNILDFSLLMTTEPLFCRHKSCFSFCVEQKSMETTLPKSKVCLMFWSECKLLTFYLCIMMFS